MRTDDIQRHPDGSIDYDFYRAKAQALRAQAMRDMIRRMPLRGGALVAAAALAMAAFAIAPTRMSAVTSAIRRALEAALEIG